jgi:hypothetical protein
VARRRRVTRKRAAAVLAPVAAGLGAIGLGTGTASAAFVEHQAEYTYVNNFDETVTCSIVSTNEFFPEDDDEAFASTFVDGPDECFESSFVTIEATYLAPGRQPVTSRAGGFGEAVGSWEPVADDFRTEHTVEFFNCDFSRSRCIFDVTLVQPK